MDLSNEEIRRYARQLTLPEVGRPGQAKLRAARVLIIGAGGLGSPLALYLAAAGVGRIGIVDFDAVEFSNLHRQVLHGTPDVGRPKVESAREALARLNPTVEVVPHATRLAAANALDLIGGYDVVVDGTDNFPARYLANDACVFLRKPNVYGAVLRFEGQASLFAPHLGGPCYRCLFPEPPPPGAVPNCAEGGVLGVLPGLIGLIQATEVIKLIVGAGTSLLGRLLLYDALDLTFRELKLRRDPQCPVCGEHPSITRLIDAEPPCGLAPNSPASMPHPDEVSVHDLKRALNDPASSVRVLDIREPAEHALARVDGAVLLPLSQLAQRLHELDPNQSYWLHCKSGVRSLRAVEFLKRQGFKAVKSVKGGIDAWSAEIDPLVPRY